MTGRRSLAAVVAVVLTACGPATLQRQFEQPTCTPMNNAVGLMAQAVPTARLLPCIAQFPAGWTFNVSDVGSGRARFWMDSDRAGMKALEVELTRTCTTAGTEIPSDEPGARLFVHLDSIRPRYTGSRFYLVPGGCVTYRFDFPAAGASVYSTDASVAIGFAPRSEYERFVERQGYHL